MNFNIDKYITNCCNSYSSEINGNVLITVSGGVDSVTSALLFKKAGVDCKFVFIDTGFMRINEVDTVLKMFKKIKLDVNLVDASKQFYSKLKNISDPKKKRVIFRNVYWNIILSYLKNNNINYIVQGTQHYVSKSKIYHNCPISNLNNYNSKVVEPVKGLSKNEIRLIAKKLNLPDYFVSRRPFPGPGLLIRFGGNYTENKLTLIRKATEVVDNFVIKYSKEFLDCYQIFPYLCDGAPVTYVNNKSQGDLGIILLIRAIKQVVGAKMIKYVPFDMDYKLREKLVKQLMSIDGIARVAFDSTPKIGTGNDVKPGGTIEYL